MLSFPSDWNSLVHYQKQFDFNINFDKNMSWFWWEKTVVTEILIDQECACQKTTYQNMYIDIFLMVHK